MAPYENDKAETPLGTPAEAPEIFGYDKSRSIHKAENNAPLGDLHTLGAKATVLPFNSDREDVWTLKECTTEPIKDRSSHFGYGNTHEQTTLTLGKDPQSCPSLPHLLSREELEARLPNNYTHTHGQNHPLSFRLHE